MSTQRNIVIARSVIDQGLTTTQAAEKFGISRQWVHVLVTRDGGFTAHESLADARRRLVEHAEYGQWELQRSVHYRDGARRYWMRRRVMRVTSTLQTV